MNRRQLAAAHIDELEAALGEARRQLRELDEELASIQDGATDARLRALVAETPTQDAELQAQERHLEALQSARAALVDAIEEIHRTRAEWAEKANVGE